MSNFWTKEGFIESLTLDVESTDLRLILSSEGPSDVQEAYALSSVADIAQYELAGPGYDRKVLSGLSVEDDAVNYRVVLQSNNPSVYVSASFGTVNGAWLYRKDSDDNSSRLWCWLGLAIPHITNGADFVFQFSPSGVFSIA